MTPQRSADGRPWLAVAIVYLVFLSLLGGASRSDELAQLPMRVLAVGVGALVLWHNPGSLVREQRWPLAFTAACLALVAVQLVPLPYPLWSTLPGRTFYAEIVRTLGLGESWRPLSMAPDLTLDAGLAALPALAGLLVAAAVPVRDRRLLLYALLALTLISVILGYAQVVGGIDSPLRLYRITNTDAMVGVFANRNHQALLLALAFPALFAIGSLQRDDAASARMVQALCFLVGLLLALTILLLGSRAGVLLGVAGTTAGLFIAVGVPRRSRRSRGARRLRLLVLGGGTAIGLGVIAAATMLDRVPAIRRLIGSGSEDEIRIQLFGPMVEAAKAFLPLGAGFGTFDAVFRRFEPVELLRTSYQNQAHNEPLQLLIEGGLPAVALLAAFLLWWVTQAIRVWRAPRTSGGLTELLPRLGCAMTGIQLLASLGDYPLRTPLHGVIFAIGCSWMLMERGHVRDTADGWSSAPRRASPVAMDSVSA